MSIKYISIVYSLLLMNFSFSGQQLKTLTVENKKENRAILYDKLTKPAAILVWYDKYYDEHSIKPCGTYNLKKFGSIRTLTIEEPTLFILPIGVQVPYLIYPSDSLIFYNKANSIPVKQGNPSIKHKTIQERTNELKFFENVFDSLGACYGVHSYSIPATIQTYNEALEFQIKKRENRILFLDRKFKQNKIGNLFYNYVKSYFIYKFYDDVFTTLKSKKYFDSSNNHLISHIADSLVNELNGKEPLNYGWYEALMSYVELKASIEEVSYQSFDSCLISIASNLIGSSRNFAVFYYYKYLLNNTEVEFLKSKLDGLKKYCNDEDYIEYISGNTSFTKSIKKNNERAETSDIVLDISKSQKRLSQIIDSLKGKAIYIDFWASWCIPCLEEIPFSKKLIEEFKGKDVVFLFLSLDSYTTRWIKSIKNNNMANSGLHYLVIDLENNVFKRKFNVGPIPRYILINKKGLVSNLDAPRPSEEKTKQLIVKLINE